MQKNDIYKTFTVKKDGFWYSCMRFNDKNDDNWGFKQKTSATPLWLFMVNIYDN